MEARRTYSVNLVINDRPIHQVVIDPHYEERHAESVNDQIILELVLKLNGRTFEPDDQDEEYEYYKTDPIEYGGKNYRLIWLLKEDCMFINAYRRP